MIFYINGVEWLILLVDPYDPVLWMGDRYTLGVTDLDEKEIYIANDLGSSLLEKVIRHEICHAVMGSYGMSMNIPDEECICKVMELHSDEVDDLADKIYREFL